MTSEHRETWAPLPWDPEVTMMWLMRGGELWVAPLGSSLPEPGDDTSQMAWMPATEAYRVHQSVLQGMHERARGKGGLDAVWPREGEEGDEGESST